MGEPTRGNARVSAAEFIGGWRQTEGTETSQYLEEEKATAIPLVAASERGTAQTRSVSSPQALPIGGCGIGSDELRTRRGVTNSTVSRRSLESSARAGDSPVGENGSDSLDPTPEYHGTRETLWEPGETTLQG
jgi:hypothetical protein